MFEVEDALSSQAVVFHVGGFYQVRIYIESYLKLAVDAKVKFGDGQFYALEHNLYAALNNFFVKNKEYMPDNVPVEVTSPFDNRITFVVNFQLVEFHESGRTKQLKASISLK